MSFHLYKGFSKKQEVGLIDHLMMFAAIIHPLTAVPQIFEIYTTHNVAGVSLWTWLGFMILGLAFLLYGLVHKIKPFILTQFLWFGVDLLVIVGILIYR